MPARPPFTPHRLHGYGLGIHLIGGGKPPTEKLPINPRGDHLSFQVGIRRTDLVMEVAGKCTALFWEVTGVCGQFNLEYCKPWILGLPSWD